MISARARSGARVGVGHSGRAWLTALAITLVAQPLGRSPHRGAPPNLGWGRAARGLGPFITSAATPRESLGAVRVAVLIAAQIAALTLGQLPPVAACPALAAIPAGLAPVVRGERR